jgi:hypothetical protein
MGKWTKDGLGGCHAELVEASGAGEKRDSPLRKTPLSMVGKSEEKTHYQSPITGALSPMARKRFPITYGLLPVTNNH